MSELGELVLGRVLVTGRRGIRSRFSLCKLTEPARQQQDHQVQAMESLGKLP